MDVRTSKGIKSALWPFCHLTFRHETHIKSPDFDLKIKWSLTRSHCFSRFTYNFSIAELTLAVTVKIPCPDCMSKTIDPKESLVKPKSLKSKQWGLFSSHIITWEENIHVRLWRKSKPPLQSVNPLLLSKCFGEKKATVFMKWSWVIGLHYQTKIGKLYISPFCGGKTFNRSINMPKTM